MRQSDEVTPASQGYEAGRRQVSADDFLLFDQLVDLVGLSGSR